MLPGTQESMQECKLKFIVVFVPINVVIDTFLPICLLYA